MHEEGLIHVAQTMPSNACAILVIVIERQKGMLYLQMIGIKSEDALVL